MTINHNITLSIIVNGSAYATHRCSSLLVLQNVYNLMPTCEMALQPQTVRVVTQDNKLKGFYYLNSIDREQVEQCLRTMNHGGKEPRRLYIKKMFEAIAIKLGRGVISTSSGDEWFWFETLRELCIDNTGKTMSENSNYFSNISFSPSFSTVLVVYLEFLDSGGTQCHTEFSVITCAFY